MRLVIDSGPIIALHKTGHFDLLSRLFSEVVVPRHVLAEVAPPGETRPGSQVATVPWIKQQHVADAEIVRMQREYDLDAGEAEAIILTMRGAEKTVLLIDERRGRKCATTLGLRTLRTGALLCRAVAEGYLESQVVIDSVSLLRIEGYFDEGAAQGILGLLAQFEDP